MWLDCASVPSLGLIDLHSLSESDIVTPFSLGLALTAVGLGTLLWFVLAITPFIQVRVGVVYVGVVCVGTGCEGVVCVDVV